MIVVVSGDVVGCGCSVGVVSTVRIRGRSMLALTLKKCTLFNPHRCLRCKANCTTDEVYEKIDKVKYQEWLYNIYRRRL